MRRHGDRSGSAPAAIVDRDGRVLGRHGGHHRFTVGQRRGIGVAATEPLYVLAKDARRNRVVVGPRAELAARSRGGRPPAAPAGRAVDAVRLRYHAARACACTRRAAGARIALEREVARAGARPDRLPDGRRSRRGLGHDASDAVPDRIVLEAPLDGAFGPVVRLIVGGIAERADFGFEDMDDLQLAIERLLAEAGVEGRVTIDFELRPGRVRARIGPAARTRPGRGAPARATCTARSRLAGVLDTVVDSYGVEDAARRQIVRAAGEAGGAA